MSRVLFVGAAVAAFGLGLTMAQADTRTVSVRAGAADLTPVGNKELSSARKKRKATKRERATVRSGAEVGGGRNARGPGEDRREESGSAM